MVKPKHVLISNGRGVHGTPRREIVEGIRRGASDARIACTQLSENCSGELPTETLTHLLPIFAMGREANKCCAGSVEVQLANAAVNPSQDHDAFVVRFAPNGLCRWQPAARPIM